MTNATPQAFRAYVDGFSGQFATVAAIQNWLTDLHARFGLKGCTLKVWRSTWAGRGCAQFASAPTFTRVL